MVTVNREVLLKLTADGSSLEEALDAAEVKSAKAQRSIRDIGSAASTIGGALTKGITVPIAAAATAATATAVKYEDAFAGVRKTVDMTGDQFDALYASTVALSETQPVSATELMNIEALGGQLGIANDRLLDFARVVAGMDIATDLDADTAATEMAQFANICGMSQGDMDRLGSTVVALGNNTAATESSIMAMAMRIAGAGTSAGMSEADIVSLSAALSSVGIEAEAGGSAISTIISNIDKSVATGSESLETWAATAGMTASEFASAWQADPVGALEAVIAGMGEGVDAGGNLSLMLEDLGVTELRQTDTMKRLANASGLLGDTVSLGNTAWRDNTALQNEVAARNDTTSAKLETLRNRVENAAAKLGGPLAEALVDVVDDLGPLIDGIGDAAEWFASLDSGTQGVIIGLAGTAAAVGPLTSALGGAATTVADVRDAVGRLTGAGDDASSAIGAAASAMGDLDKKDTKESTSALKDKLRGGADTAAAGVEAVAGAMDSVDKKDVKNATGAIEAAADVAGAAGDAVGGVADAMDSVDKKDVKKATGAIGAAADVAGAAGDAVGGVADAMDVVDKKDVKNAAGAIGAAADVAGAAGEAVGGVADAIDDVDKKDVKRATGAIEGVGTAAGTAARVGVAALKVSLVALAGYEVIQAIAGVVGNLQNAKEQAELTSEVAGGLKGALEGVGDADMSAAGDSIASLKQDMSDFREETNNAAQDAVDLYDGLAGDSFTLESQIGQVSEFADTIEELSGRESLSTIEQVKLRDAVDGFNSATGSSISIIDEQTGAIDTNVQSIRDMSAAYEAQARYEGYHSGYLQVLSEQGNAMAGLATATQKQKEAQEAFDEEMRNSSTSTNILASEITFLDDGVALYSQSQLTARLALDDANAALDTASARVDAAGDAVAAYEPIVAAAKETVDGLADSSSEEATAVDGSSESVANATGATEDAAAALVDYATASGESVKVTKEQSDAFDELSGYIADTGSAIESIGGGALMGTLSQMGMTAFEFGDAVEAAGGGIEHLAAVYDGLASASDPFEKISASLAYTGENAQAASDGLGQLARTTDEVSANIAADQATVDAFSQVVSDLYAQCATEADIAFVDSLVEKGPAALGELQNIAGTYDDANVDLHSLADAQDHLNDSIAASAVSAELERMSAAYRVLGTEALSSAFIVDEATGNVVTSVGQGADAMVVTFDGATGDVVSCISASAPEAQAAAEQLAQAAADGVGGATDALSSAGSDSGAGFAEGVASGSDDAAGSGSLLGDSSYDALATLPDEMEARGKVAGYELGYGIKSQSGAVSEDAAALSTSAGRALAQLPGNMGSLGSAAGGSLASGILGQAPSVGQSSSALSNAAGRALSGMPGDMWSLGNSAGWQLASGVIGQGGNAWSAGSALASNASSGMDSGGWAYSSGQGLGANFAAGIRSQYSNVYSASLSLASAASSLLHHSVPDEGPLSDDDEWGFELGENIASGMRASEASVRAAALALASAASGARGQLVAPEASDLTAAAQGPGQVVVEAMYVRKESDIEDVAESLHRLQRREMRKVGQ